MRMMMRMMVESLRPVQLSLISVSLFLLRLFLCLVLVVSLYNARRLFLEPIGRMHRLSGLIHFMLLIYGAFAVVNQPPAPTPMTGDDDSASIIHNDWSRRYCLLYDICLGIMGTITTLSAAKSFPHKTISNKPGQSGTLAEHAYVTQSEMVEHSFYQILNIIQSIYLHYITQATRRTPTNTEPGSWWWGRNVEKLQDKEGTNISVSFSMLLLLLLHRFVAVLLVTSPWLIRQHFPVHSFSDNWTKQKKQKKEDRNKNDTKHTNGTTLRQQSSSITTITSTTEWLEVRLYQIKKWQYVFYKHVILHGLNISVAFPSSDASTTLLPLPLTKSFRIFWVCLQTSYVMEFYLQSLVKRKYLQQNTMLILQRLLMTAASISAVLAVNQTIRPGVCILSCVLNFINRKQDLINVMSIVTMLMVISIHNDSRR